MDRFILFLFVLICGRSIRAAEAVIVASEGAHQPQLSMAPDGGVHLAFGARTRILFARSTDGGETFGRPVEVAELDALMLGMRRGPRIASTSEMIVISAIGQVGAGEKGNLYSWRSTDHGESWQGPTQVNDAPASAREGLHAMAAGPGGACYCVWLDLRNKGTQIYSSRSPDGGATWSKNREVYASPSGSVCECCHPSVAVDGRERVHVMWRNSVDGNRDMYLATSSDQGETFSEAVKLGSGSWPLDACPMDGGGLAVSSAGEVATVWRRDQVVFLAGFPLVQEISLGAGRQPWIAADQRGHYAVWLNETEEKLYFANSLGAAPSALAEGARFPVIAARPNGEGLVVVAWESGDQEGSAIKVVRILEN